jgi:hypothetical protein
LFRSTVKKPELLLPEPFPVKEETVQPEKAPAPVTKEEGFPLREKTVPAKRKYRRFR